MHGNENNKEREINLTSSLTEKLNEATGASKLLENSLNKVGDVAKKVGESLGIPLGVDQLIEFGKKSDELFDSLEKANAQISLGIASTRNAAGITMQQLQEDQEVFRSKIDYSRAAIADLQAQLLAFPSITKDTFNDAAQSVLDMATRQHGDLKATAIAVGKALQNPVKGIEDLSAAGVHFTDTQAAMVKKMAETGKTAQAQAIILKELEADFGGSAAAAAAANPFFEYDKSVEDLQLDIGETIKELKETVAPFLIDLVKDFKDVWDWGIRNKELVKDLATGIGTAWITFKVLSGAKSILLSISEAFTIEETAAAAATTETTAFAAALDATPIGLFAVALGGIVMAFQAIGTNARTAREEKNKFLEEQYAEEKTAIAPIYDSYDAKANYDAKHYSGTELEKHLKKDKNDYLQVLGNEIAKYQGIVDGTNKVADSLVKNRPDALTTFGGQQALNIRMGDLNNSGNRSGDDMLEITTAQARIKALQQEKDKYINSTQAGILKPANGTSGNYASPDHYDPRPSAAKATTINIKINDLVKELNLHSTTIQGGAKQIKDIITEVLLSAVNDSQHIAHD